MFVSGFQGFFTHSSSNPSIEEEFSDNVWIYFAEDDTVFTRRAHPIPFGKHPAFSYALHNLTGCPHKGTQGILKWNNKKTIVLFAILFKLC